MPRLASRTRSPDPDARRLREPGAGVGNSVAAAATSSQPTRLARPAARSSRFGRGRPPVLIEVVGAGALGQERLGRGFARCVEGVVAAVTPLFGLRRLLLPFEAAAQRRLGQLPAGCASTASVGRTTSACAPRMRGRGSQKTSSSRAYTSTSTLSCAERVAIARSRHSTPTSPPLSSWAFPPGRPLPSRTLRQASRPREPLASSGSWSLIRSPQCAHDDADLIVGSLADVVLEEFASTTEAPWPLTPRAPELMR